MFLDVAISMVDLFCRLVSGIITSVRYGRLGLWDMGQLYQITTILTWSSTPEVNSHSQYTVSDVAKITTPVYKFTGPKA